jgi:hypothetical protein
MTSILDAGQAQAIAKSIFICPPQTVKPLVALLHRYGATPLAVTTGNCPDEIQANAVNEITHHARNDALEHICILGAWDDVPPFYLPNPASCGGDPDEYCLSDAPYGIPGGLTNIAEDDILSSIPSFSVGRLPASDISLFERVLNSKPSTQSVSDALDLVVTAECWNEATDAIVERITKGARAIPHSNSPASSARREGHLMNSPDWDLHALRQSIANQPFKPEALIFFNVHGSDESTYWFGEGRFSGGAEVFHPSASRSFPNVVLMTEACYGGSLGYEEPSMVEHFFSSGGRAFVGCSVVAYGTPDASLSGADILAFKFINGLEDGKSFAEALNFAKLELSVSNPESPEISFKTVRSFNLYGLPWQHFSAQASSSSPALGRRPLTTEIRESLRNRLDGVRGRVSERLSDRREDYRARVPDPLKRFIIEKQNFLLQLSQFRDYAKIQTIIADLGVEISDCRLEKVNSKDFQGYRLHGQRKMSFGTMQHFQVVTSTEGAVSKFIVSKG